MNRAINRVQSETHSFAHPSFRQGLPESSAMDGILQAHPCVLGNPLMPRMACIRATQEQLPSRDDDPDTNYGSQIGRGIAVFIVLYLTSMSHSWAAGGAESMDRPSARPLPAIPNTPDDEQNQLILPPVPPRQEALSTSEKLYLKKIIITGNTVFAEQDLTALTHAYTQREVSVAEIEELRENLTQYYIDHGYLNSGAIIPENALKNGELHIDIIEGRLNEILISGQGRLREGYIKNRLQGEPNQPFNLNDLQDRFQMLLSDPLIKQMQGQILPGAAPGQSILDVNVVRAKPYHLALFGDNYRPPSIGGEAFGLESWLRNLTGLGDVLDFSFINSAGYNRYFGGFSLPLSAQDTLAFFRFDEGDASIIEESIKDLNIKSQVHALEGGISHPIINHFKQRLNLGIVFAVRENNTSLLGEPFPFASGEFTANNQATVLRLFQESLWRGNNQALTFRSTFNIGLPVLGATAKTSQESPSSEFFSWLGQAQYAYRLMDNGAQIVVRSNAQFSDSPLLPLEQIAIGGVSTVRGYRENHLVRDNGYNFNLEFHYPLIADSDPDYGHQLTLIPFVDYGEAWDRFDNGSGNNQPASIYSVGVGFRWQYNLVSTDFFYGHALNPPSPNTSGDIQDSGVHFQTRLNIF